MRKIILSVAIGVLTLMGVNAQNIHFGAKGGINLASLDIENAAGTINGRTSFHLGGVVNIELSENIGIQSELLYSAQGANSNVNGFESTIKLDYINVPVLLDYKVLDNFSLQGGPQIGFNINAETETDNSTFEIPSVETIDLALAFGAQYTLEQGIFFQSRYSLGLTDYAQGIRSRNNVFSLSVGYFFN
ncbi:hypothetical protein GCM10011344_02650 [Dokdonia pacifica]|uniref:Outer membrane protein beta-barrel domain-containing protein n=1 Tax=Dokdonia pacifica TaxID=1627892 RepID=A0A238ZEI7_9FLAO|nr:porin family protein [Dokdonia pacifica]GGG05648.1 hypothetical protein GCM10011344_02650 [Dokdonia pacifica]SNR81163.1 Outer membrane protein beta-barrel domain-containing protein [Dokdonia pacifica]